MNPLRPPAGLRVSALVRDLGTGQDRYAVSPERVVGTASVGKLLLLDCVAAQLDSGELKPLIMIDRDQVAPVSDSGLLRHLQVGSLPLIDLAVLVASVSDNWATNLLIEQVGLDRVRGRAAERGITASALCDVVREQRVVGQHPVQLSSGCAADYVAFLGDIHPQVLRWMQTSTDHSLVLAPLALDPLSASEGSETTVANKTGCDTGIRADVGLVSRGSQRLAYAVLTEFDDPADASEAVGYLRDVGQLIAGALGD